MPPTGPPCSSGPTLNATTADPQGHQEQFKALLYIVVTLLFYSLGIVIGIITYLKRERREMEEDKAFDDFMTWQNDPFTTIKAQRVQQMAARLQQLEDIKHQREIELFQRELEIGAGAVPTVRSHDQKKGHSLKIPRFNWSRSSWRGRKDDDSVSRDGGRSPSEDYTGIPLQAVAGFTGIACQFIAPQYVMTPSMIDGMPPGIDVKGSPYKNKLNDPNERRNCLRKTPRLVSRQERLQSGEFPHHDTSLTSPTTALLTSPNTTTLPFIDAYPNTVDPNSQLAPLSS